jgi:hypothetical protein
MLLASSEVELMETDTPLHLHHYASGLLASSEVELMEM